MHPTNENSLNMIPLGKLPIIFGEIALERMPFDINDW